MPIIQLKGPRDNLHYYLICYSRKGEEKLEADGSLLSKTLAAQLADPATCPYTDVFISSHGYNTDRHDADDSYQQWMGAMADDKANRAAIDAARLKEVDKPFNALMIGIQWPSKLWTAKFVDAVAGKFTSTHRSMGATLSAADAGGTADPAVAQQLGELVDHMNEDDAAVADRPAVKDALRTLAGAAVRPPEVVATAASAIDAGTGGVGGGGGGVQKPLPSDIKDAYQAMADALAAVDAESTDGEDDESVKAADPDVAFAAAIAELTEEATAVKAAEAKAAAAKAAAAKTAASPPSTDVPAGAAVGATGATVESLGFGTIVASTAAAALLRRTAIIILFGRYQQRAKVIGRTGVRQLLATLMAAAGRHEAGKRLKFHAVGHSLGAHVVSSAVVGPHGARPPLPAKVHSLVLVQGAVPAGAYGAGGPYGALLVAGGPVAGVTVATHSLSDGALWFYGRAYGGEPLGRVGATHSRPSPPLEVTMLAATEAYRLTPGAFVNVNAGAYIDKVSDGLGGKLVGSHNDVTNAETMHLVWAAALVEGGKDDGGAAEGATR